MSTCYIDEASEQGGGYRSPCFLPIPRNIRPQLVTIISVMVMSGLIGIVSSILKNEDQLHFDLHSAFHFLIRSYAVLWSTITGIFNFQLAFGWILLF